MPVLNGVIWAIIGLTSLVWFFGRDGETSRPWISRSQFARGEVMNLASIGGAAETLGTAGIAFVYVRATPNDAWTKIGSSYYLPTPGNSPIDTDLYLSRDGDLLYVGGNPNDKQWAYEFSSRKLLRSKTSDLKQIAELHSQLKRLIARHGALSHLKFKTWRASPWKWADTQAKQLMQEELSQSDL